TGDLSWPLVQCLSGRLAVTRASSPASRMTVSSLSFSAPRSLAGNSQSLQPHRGRVDAVAEVEIVRRRQRAEDIEQMSSDGDLAHGKSLFAVLDPEAGGAAAVVAGHHVDAATDQIGDVETVLDVDDEFVRHERARFEMQVARAWRRPRRDATAGVAGGLEPEFARRGAIENPRAQYPVIDQRQLLAGDAFAVEGMRAQAALAQRIVDDADAVGEQLLAHLVF